MKKKKQENQRKKEVGKEQMGYCKNIVSFKIKKEKLSELKS